MDQTYIYDFWKDAFVHYDRDEIAGYSLTKATKELLCEIGLPINYEFLDTLNITFYHHFEQVNVEDRNYVVFGDDYGTKFGISEQTDQVFSLDLEEETNVRFVNSNIECFLLFFQIYFMNRHKLSICDEPEVAEIIKSLKTSFNKIDVAALNNDDNWWTIILEQVEQGLL